MRTVLLEWHLAVDSSLTDAVNTFREELGLPIQEDSEDDRETAIGYMSEGSLASSSGFHSNRGRLSSLDHLTFESDCQVIMICL